MDEKSRQVLSQVSPIGTMSSTKSEIEEYKSMILPVEEQLTLSHKTISLTVSSQSSHDTATIRKLVTEGLSDEELDNLCMDHFPKIWEQFSSGMSKPQKVNRLIEYCNRHDRMPYLLNLIEEANPEKYAVYESGLTS